MEDFEFDLDLDGDEELYSEELAQNLTDALKEVLPPHIKCVIVLANLNTGMIATLSDLHEDDAAELAMLGAQKLKDEEDEYMKITPTENKILH